VESVTQTARRWKGYPFTDHALCSGSQTDFSIGGRGVFCNQFSASIALGVLRFARNNTKGARDLRSTFTLLVIPRPEAEELPRQLIWMICTGLSAIRSPQALLVSISKADGLPKP